MKEIELVEIKRTDPRLVVNMKNHYSEPKGFVGRNICYAIMCDGVYYGAIVGGSATLHLPKRNEYFEVGDLVGLNNIINNIFFHLEKIEGKYPIRNMTQKVLKIFRDKIKKRWKEKYGDFVVGFESLVELPREGFCYIRDGWTEVSQTKGFTCKRIGGKGTEKWTGKRIWDKKTLRPKRVFLIKDGEIDESN